MTRHFHIVDTAARAVADGYAVDWDLLEAQAPLNERPVIRQLRKLGPPRRADPDRPPPRRHRLSLADWAARVVVAAAAIQVALAFVAARAVIRSGSVGLASPVVFPGTPLAFAAGAALLLWGGRGDRAARALGGVFLLVASAFTGAHTAALLSKDPNLSGLAPTWLFGLPLDAFLPPLLFTFVAAFPRLPTFVRPQAVAERLVSATWATGLVLFAGNILLMGLTPDHRTTLAWLDRTRPLDSVYWTIVCGFIVVALGLAGWKSRRVLSEERTRTASLLLAVSAGIAPLALTSLMVGMGGSSQAWVMLHRTEAGLVVYGGLLTIPLSTAYLVLSRRVFDVRWALGRGAAYRVARSASVVSAALTASVLLVYLHARRETPLGQLVIEPVPCGLVVAALCAAAWAFRRRAWSALLDDWFFGERRDIRASLLALALTVDTPGDTVAPARALLQEVKRSLRIERADMLLLDVQSGVFAPVAGIHHRALEATSLLTELVARTREPVSLDLEERRSVASWLPEDERQWILDTGCRLAVPVFGTGSALSGILVLGSKGSGRPYTREDRRFATHLAEAAALLREARLAASDDTGAGTTPDFGVPSGTAAFECQGCGLILGSSSSCSCGGVVGTSPLPLVLAGKFRIEQRIGRGGMGVVYRAVDLDLERYVAIKTLPRTSVRESTRLRREARAMARVVHPNLASIYGLEVWRGVPLLVVEHFPDGTLADRLRRGPMSPADAATLGRALASALESMHHSGLLHRDIKPSNIGFQHDGTPKLLDFGLVQMLTEPLPAELSASPAAPSAGTSSVERMGTPAYVPPEAFEMWEDDPLRDLWSLALVMYEAIAGINPRLEAVRPGRAGGTEKQSIPDVRTYAPHCPAALAEFLAGALAPDRGDRPRTARAFRTAVVALEHRPPV